MRMITAQNMLYLGSHQARYTVAMPSIWLLLGLILKTIRDEILITLFGRIPDAPGLLLASFLTELADTPRGTVPWLWRVVCGRYEHVESMKGMRVLSKNVVRENGRLKVTGGGMANDRQLRRKFRDRLMYPTLIVAYAIFAYKAISALFPMGGEFFTIAPGFALTVFDSTGGGGNWNDTASWTQASFPQTGDDVTIDSGDTITVNVASVTGTLVIDGTLALSTNTLEMEGDVTISSTGLLTFNSGTLRMKGGDFDSTDGNITRGDSSSLMEMWGSTLTGTPAFFKLGVNAWNEKFFNITFGEVGGGFETRFIEWEAQPVQAAHRRFIIFGDVTDGDMIIDDSVIIRLNDTDDAASLAVAVSDVVIRDTTIPDFHNDMSGTIELASGDSGGSTLSIALVSGAAPQTITSFGSGTYDVNVQFFLIGTSLTLNINASLTLEDANGVRKIIFLLNNPTLGTINIGGAGPVTLTCGELEVALTAAAASTDKLLVDLNSSTLQVNGNATVDRGAGGGSTTAELRVDTGNFNVTGTTDLGAGGSITSVSGVYNLDGLLTIASGATFNAGSGTSTMAGITVSGGTFNGNSADISEGVAGADITVSGGTFNAGSGSISYDGSGSVLTVNGGTLNGDTCDLSIEDCNISSGTLDVDGGIFTVDDDLILSGTGILNGGAGGTIRMRGATGAGIMDLQNGTWNKETSTIELSEAGQCEIRFDANIFFYNLNVKGPNGRLDAQATMLTFCVENALTIDASDVLTLTSTNTFTLLVLDVSIDNFDNLGTISGSGSHTLLFRFDADANRTLGNGGNGIGTLSIPTVIENNSIDVRTISLGNDIPLASTITLDGSANVLTLDMLDFDITVSSAVVVNGSDEIENTATVTDSTITGVLTLGGTLNLPVNSTMIITGDFTPTGTLDGTDDGTLDCGGNCDLSGLSSYLSSQSTLVMSGTTKNLTIGNTSDLIHNLTITGTTTFISGATLPTATIENILTINGASATLKITAGDGLFLEGLTPVVFTAGGNFHPDKTGFLNWVHTGTGQTVSVPGSLNYPTSDFDSSGSNVNTYALTGAATFVSITTGTVAETFDCDTFELGVTETTIISSNFTLDLGSFTGGDGHNFTGLVTINGILEGASGEAEFDAGLDMSSGTFNKGTSFFKFNGGNIQTQAASQEFFDVQIDAATILTTGDMVHTSGSWTNNSLFTINSGRALIFVDQGGISAWDNSGGTIAGAGLVRLRADTPDLTIIMGAADGVLNVPLEIISTSGASKLTMGASLVVGFDPGAFTLTVGLDGGSAMDLDMASFELKVAGTTTVESGCELDLGTFSASDGHNFNDIAVVGDLVIDTASLTVAGNWDLSSGTFTPGGSFINFTGTGKTIQTGSNSDTFADVQNDGTYTLTSSNMIFPAGQFLDNNATITVDGSSILTMLNNGIAGFDNTGGIVNGSGTLEFRIDDGANASLNGNTLGDIDDSPLTTKVVLDVAGSGSAKVTMINASMLPYNFIVESEHASNTMEFDTGVFITTVDNDFTIGTRGIFTQGQTLNVSGNWNSNATGAVYNNGSQTTSLSGTSKTIATNSNTEDFFDLLHNSGTPSYTLTAGDMRVTNSYTSDGTFTVNSGSTLFIEEGALSNFDNTGGTIAGVGELTFTAATSSTFSVSNFATLTIDVRFERTANDPVFNLTDATTPFSTTGKIDIEQFATVETDENFTCDGGTISGTLQPLTPTTGLNNDTWTFNQNILVRGIFNVDIQTSGFNLILNGAPGLITFQLAPQFILKSDSWANKIIVTAVRGFVFADSDNTEDTPIDMQFVDYTGSSTSSASAVEINADSKGSIKNCQFKAPHPTLLLLESSSSSFDWLVDSCNFESSGSTLDIMNINNLETPGFNKFVMRNCTLKGGLRSIRMEHDTPSGVSFAGKIENCLLDGAITGIWAEDGGFEINSLLNCAITNAATDDILVGTDLVAELVGCLFDENNITIGSGAEIRSHLHKRENTKTLILCGGITIDDTLFMVQNQDNFDWSHVDGEWNIDLSLGEFESLAISTGGGLKSIFVPTLADTVYYLKFGGTVAGNIGASGTITVTSYELDQTTVVASTTIFVFNGATQVYEGSLDTGADAVFIQWAFEASAADEVFNNVEVRETDVDGSLIFNEDLINNYQWQGNDINYNLTGIENVLNFEITATLNTDIVTFGASDTNAIDVTDMDFVVTGSGADRIGVFQFGRQNANNYYYLEFNRVTGTITFNKVVATVVTPLDTITGVIVADTGELRVRWDGAGCFLPNTTSPVIGSLEVSVDGVVQTWITSGSLTTVDTTFSVGNYGFSGRGWAWNNYTISHFGFFQRDVDVILCPADFITLESDGKYNFVNGSVNASRSQFINNGGLFNEVNVTFTEDVFDQSVNSPISLNCVNTQVTGDVVFGNLGLLSAFGSIFEHKTNDFWTFKTENSSFDPPMTIKSCHFRNLNTRFRPLEGADAPYEIDQAFEIVIDAPEPDHPVNVISHEVWGRQSNRNIVKSHSDHEVTITFTTFDDNCLYGFLRKWQDEEILLEVVWPRGYIHKCKIIDTTGGPVNPGMTVLEFSVTLQEFR